MKLRDTIAAISTPPGRGGLGIIRLSGGQARDVAERMLRFPPDHQWKPWSSALASLPDAEGQPVDRVVTIFFAAPKSYTAEDVVEISCHGSPEIGRAHV